ncbi:MAG: diphthamide synthesis protein [archaeon]
MQYDLELDRVKKEIKRIKARKVLVQLPDGLKPKATDIVRELEKTGAKVFIWGGSCFGACDTPYVKGFDLLVQFGHSKWKE